MTEAHIDTHDMPDEEAPQSIHGPADWLDEEIETSRPDFEPTDADPEDTWFTIRLPSDDEMEDSLIRIRELRDRIDAEEASINTYLEKAEERLRQAKLRTEYYRENVIKRLRSRESWHCTNLEAYLRTLPPKVRSKRFIGGTVKRHMGQPKGKSLVPESVMRFLEEAKRPDLIKVEEKRTPRDGLIKKAITSGELAMPTGYELTPATETYTVMTPKDTVSIRAAA